MELIRSGWQDLVLRVGRQFTRPQTRDSASCYMQGLLSRIERKNGWQLSEAAGHDRPDRLQYLLERAKWSAEEARSDLIAYVRDAMPDKRGVLVLDETGFLKKGEQSVGVQRQYSGTAGRIDNCQIGVFMAYATAHGRTLIDRELYLPKSWVDNPDRCTRAGVPSTRTFSTKPQLAIAMLARARAHGLHAAWVLGDEVYGNDYRLRHWCEVRKQPYVLAVSCQHRVWMGWRQVRLDHVLAKCPDDVWRTLSAGDGCKGERLYDWAFLSDARARSPKGCVKGYLFRRSLTTGDISYYAVLAKPHTTLQQLAETAGRRWAVEECFQSAKGEVGLDEYEVRTWDAWHRHMTLAMWAHAFLTIQRCRLATNKKKSANHVMRAARTAVRSRNTPHVAAVAMV